MGAARTLKQYLIPHISLMGLVRVHRVDRSLDECDETVQVHSVPILICSLRCSATALGCSLYFNDLLLVPFLSRVRTYAPQASAYKYLHIVRSLN